METKSYWDLSEKDRAALTSEQVEQHCGYELMAAGVLRVAPLELTPEPKAPEPQTLVYRVRKRDAFGRGFDVAFADPANAQRFAELAPLMVSTEWLGGSTAEYVEPMAPCEMVAVNLYSKAEVDLHKATLRKAAEIRQANEKATQEHAKATKAQDDALAGLWADWMACRAKAAQMERVADTFAEYVKMAGSEVLAARFLAKAFPAPTIANAVAWFGRPELEASEQAAA